jgi:hypothetical protein
MSIILTPTSSDIDYTNYYSNIHTFPTRSPIVSQIVSPIVQLTPMAMPGYYQQNIDTGINDSWTAQKQMTKYILDRIYKHWMREKDMRKVLKFMTVDNNQKVVLVKNEEEYNKNDVSNDSKDTIGIKSDFIRENILGTTEMRKILMKIMEELGYKWKMFTQPKEEKIVIDVTKKYLKKHLRQMIGIKKNEFTGKN